MKPDTLSYIKISRKCMILILLALVILFLAYFINSELKTIKNPLINKVGQTIIYRTASFDIMANNTIMIVSKEGKVIIMDPFEIIPGVEADFITVSHLHGDHYDKEFTDQMNCTKSISKIDSLTENDIIIRSFPSSHNNRPIDEKNLSNVIYIVEVDSLRIAHLGDLGQNFLTDKQEKVLKDIDLLIMPCSNPPISPAAIQSIITAVNPKIILTTHKDSKGLKILRNYTSESIVRKDSIVLDNSLIKENRSIFVSLERNNKSVLYLRYFIYDFPDSPLFKIIVFSVFAVIAVVWSLKKIRKSINFLQKTI